MRRALIWGAVALVLVGALAVWLVPRLLGTDTARHELEKILSEALDRPVTVESLEVTLDPPQLTLTGVEVGESEAFEDQGPMLRARALVFDLSMADVKERRIVGSVVARGVRLHVVRRDGALNLAGLGRKRDPDAKSTLDLRLDVALEGAEVAVEDFDHDERLDLEGVGLQALLSNRPDEKEARLQLTVAAVDVREIPLRNVMLHGRVTKDAWVVHRVRAEVGDSGVVEGSGRATLKSVDGGQPWHVDVEARDVRLEGPVADAVARAYPLVAAGAGTTDSGLAGLLGASLKLDGRGLAWESVAPTLAGEVGLSLRDVTIPQEAMVLQLAALAGRKSGPLTIEEGSVDATIAEGWITLARARTGTGDLDPHLSGRVSLAGELDLKADLLPLVRMFGGGAYAGATRYTTSLPVRIGGTVRDPDLQAPAAADVAKGLAGGLLKRALSGNE